MKIIRLALKDLMSKKSVSILLMLQLLAGIITLNISLALYNNYNSLKSLVSKSGISQCLYFYPNPEHILSDNRDITDAFSKIDSIESIGNTYKTSGGFIGGDDIIDVLLIDDNILESIELPLSDGKWFAVDKTPSDVVPIICSSRFKDKYELNGVYDMRIIKDPSNGSDYYDIEGQIIGFLREPDYTLSLSGSRLESVFQKNFNGIIIPNDKSLFGDIVSPHGATSGTLVFISDEANLKEIENVLDENMKPFGTTVSFEELQKEYDTGQKPVYSLTMSLAIIALAVSVAGIGGHSALSAISKEKNYALYYMCGAKWRTCMGIILLKDLLLFAIPLAISYLITEIGLRYLHADIFSGNIRNLFMSGAICLIIYLLTSVGPLIGLYKQSPVSIIRKWV